MNAKARIGYGSNRIIVDDCPYCHKTHLHNLPVGKGKRMADCFQGEYDLVFDNASSNGSPSETIVCEKCGLPLVNGKCIDCD